MNITKSSLATVLLVPIVALGVSSIGLLVNPAEPQVSAQIRDGLETANSADTPDVLFGGTNSIFTTIVNLLLFLIGAVAVIMLVFGGFRYVTSGGDASAVTAAKNTILYAIVGIVVAILAYAIVQFVVGRFTSSTSTAAPAEDQSQYDDNER